MDCPYCGNKSKVLDSRTQEDDSTKRKRRCLVCNYGYWTTERLLSEWEKLWDATPRKQPQTTQPKKVVQRAARITRPKKILEMSDEELEEAIFNDELNFDEDEL